MSSFAYRAVDRRGQAVRGQIQARDRAEATTRVRGLGVTPLELVEAAASDKPVRGAGGHRARAETTKVLDELGVLVNAGLPLDRALALCIDNIESKPVAAEFRRMLANVREGATLSSTMAERPALFPASAQAIVQAGESSGRLGEALARVSSMFNQTEEMRRLIVGAMIYPAALLLLAIGVILMMLLYVVPQFEGLFNSARDKLPASSLFLMSISQILRAHSILIFGTLFAAGFATFQILRGAAAQAVRDRLILQLPQIGMLVRYIESARLARTLAGLVVGGVPLPEALAMSCRAIGNRTIAAAIAGVATEIKEGGALTARIAATGALPRVAIGFFRTGEETSQLGMMLERLANMLERDVSLRIERIVAIATPLITVGLGGAVAAIIASIMTAILGFNDLAVSQ